MRSSLPILCISALIITAADSSGTRFCEAPNPSLIDNELQHCRFTGDMPPLNGRTFTGECGPNCRPSCLTLMLDLHKVDYQRDISCRPDELCQCSFDSCGSCWEGGDTVPAACSLEQASCLGGTVYDDITSLIKKAVQEDSLAMREMEHCAAIPDGSDELYGRFRDWPLVRPMEMSCDGEACFTDEKKIFFEFCNVVQEDPLCDPCTDDWDDTIMGDPTSTKSSQNTNQQKCSSNCPKIVEPFPPGWTSFVVSAPIPRSEMTQNSECHEQYLEYDSSETDTVCFMERVDVYYPPPLAGNCTESCPHCHDCPLLKIGDRFGPLEVVGFGHSIDTPCAACDAPEYRECSHGSPALDCHELLNCEGLVECATEKSLGLPVFQLNKCSFCEAT